MTFDDKLALQIGKLVIQVIQQGHQIETLQQALAKTAQKEDSHAGKAE